MRSLLEMDRLGYVRFALIIAIAATAYMLLLRWQADYGALNSQDNSTATSELPLVIDHFSMKESGAGLPSLSNDVVPEQSDLPVVPSVTQQPLTNPEQPGRSPSRLITVSTGVLDLQIDLLGGDIIQAQLPMYPESHESTTGFKLLSDEVRHFVAQTGVIGTSTNLDLDEKSRPLFNSESQRYVLTGEEPLSVELHFENETLKARKVFMFLPGQYEFTVEVHITNKSQSVWNGSFFGLIERDGSDDPSAATGGFGLPTFNGAAYWGEEKKYNKVDFDDFNEYATKPLLIKHAGGWVAWVQHYFLSAWIPSQDKDHAVIARPTSKGYAISFTETVATSIPSNATKVFGARGYLGPKIERNLGAIADGLNLAVDYGFLFMISKLLFQILSFIQGFVGNWGVAIILLTLFVKALFLWPSAISYKSMARMRKLQPHLTRLKDEFGQDRQRMSQEMIKLYQKEKVNPFGGCLPVLMQMPVFIALYWALLESVELRQAPFFGWIQDLSVMDPYFILPLLMGVSMYIQTSLNPTPPDPTQAKVMKFMPVMFTVFFLFFPAGLVLYWLTNNILSIIQQWYITRRIEAGG